jgi:hypothetical protein
VLLERASAALARITECDALIAGAVQHARSHRFIELLPWLVDVELVMRGERFEQRV